MEFNFEHRNQLPHFLNHLNLIGKGVELGTFKGDFSKVIISSWIGKLYLVDVWRPLSLEDYNDISNGINHQDAYKETMDKIKGYEDRTFMLRMDGKSASELFEDMSLDFVYIDANHTYQSVKEDIEDWYPKIKSGGLLLGHDYMPSYLYNGESKDVPIYYTEESDPNKPIFCGMFGVNTAVDEFCKSNEYTVNVTSEYFGTWWIIKH